MAGTPPRLALAGDSEADALLASDPLALLIGMVLDQQIPLERAFRSPLELAQRLGRPLDAAELAFMDPAALGAIFAQPPALHRFPGSMAARVSQLCRVIVEDYDGKPSEIWDTAATGSELLARVKALPGFGAQKAAIFVALLGKQLGVRPPGWEQAAGPFGAAGSMLSVADIDGPESLAQVRAHKKEMKAAARQGQSQASAEKG
jgi:uncharacterized HhH-GPD family protein